MQGLKMIKKFFHALPTYSLLFGLYPVLSLFATNRFELQGMEPFLILRPLLISFLFVFIVYLLFWPLMRTPLVGELSTFLFLIFFYSYGHVENLLSLRGIPNKILFPLWLFMFGLGMIIILRNKEKIPTIKKPLIIVTAVLICFPTYELVTYSLLLQKTEEVKISSTTQIETAMTEKFSGLLDQPEKINSSDYIDPFDIYYIVLDGYGRADILANIYQYNNQPFINKLKARGFYVAEDSYANYNQTRLSIPSSLNMEYMQNIGFSSRTAFDLEKHWNLLSNSKVFNKFSNEEGYFLVNFRSGYEAIDIQTLDYFMEIDGDSGVHLSDLPIIKVFGRSIALSNFEILFMQMTILKPFFKDMVQSVNESPLYQDHRDRILFIFDHLPDFASADGNYFVYAHIPAPHPPFVFFEDGTNRENFLPFDMSDGSQYLTKLGKREEYISRYKAQITYINQLVLDTIDEILETSENPPIIILQGDHGPGAYFDWESLSNTYLPERFAILNAYYFPDKNYENLYPSISPVNSFRVVIGQYLMTEIDFLDDLSFFSTFDNPYRFEDVTDDLD
jgi:hypothetical protein